ncbi:hypothetical protein IMX07_13915 [bacterium]|nr:hypothetical protein [bacterium]
MTRRARLTNPPAQLAESMAALAIYAIASIVFFGIPLFPDFRHLRLGFGPAGDPQIPIWGLAWYPWALAHHLNPFRTDFAWAPYGCTLAWSTTIPGAALVMWPVTGAFGPIASYNVLCLLAPALSAYTAFLLCRRIAGGFRAALVGGFIFGFSTYVSGELLHHLSLAMVFLVPLFPYLGLIYLDGKISSTKFVASAVALIVFQFLLSPEILATTTLFCGAAVLTAGRLYRESVRDRLKNLAWISAASYAIAAVLLAPALAYFFPSPFGITPVFNPAHCSTDLLNFLLPFEPSMLARVRPVLNFDRNLDWGCEAGAFLGLLPLIAISYSIGGHESAGDRLLIAMLLIIAIATLGPVLHVNGKALLPLPWLFAMPIPLLNNALPARFSAYLFLVLAIITARWLASQNGSKALRWMVATVAAASILPVFPMTQYAVRDSLPQFFTRRLYKTFISQKEIVLILPFASAGYSLLWQAEADFAFRMPQGRLMAENMPLAFARWPIVSALAQDNPDIPGASVQLAAFLGSYGITKVLIDPAAENNFANLFEGFRWRRSEIGGVELYQIDPAELGSFRSISAAEMETRYNLARFGRLLHAAHTALDLGLGPSALNPEAMRARGLLDSAVAGDKPRLQLSDYAFLAKLRRSRIAVAIVGYLAGHVHIDVRLMAELGPARKPELTTSGVWLGPWGADGVAIGIVGDRAGIEATLRNYSRAAAQIFYPYPLSYRAGRDFPDGQNLLLMVFPRAALGALDGDYRGNASSWPAAGGGIIH